MATPKNEITRRMYDSIDRYLAFATDKDSYEFIRMLRMYQMRLEGNSYKKIGKQFNLSRQRVHQIIGKVNTEWYLNEL